MTDCVALVLAAGLGTRMKSGRAKVLHQVLGRPMVIYPIEAALAAGVERVVVVVGHQREALEAAVTAHFGAQADSSIAFAVQAEQLGTGHAVLCGLSRVEPSTEEVLVLNGDLPNLTRATLVRLLEETRRAGASMGLLTAVAPDPHGLGRIVRDAEGRPTAIVEHTDADADQRAIAEVNAGAYLFAADFMRRHIDGLDRENAARELYLTDLVASAAAGGRHACAVQVSDFEEVAGVNTRVHLARAEAYARRRRNRELMLAGVTLRDPETTWVEADCEVAADVTLGPGVMLRGRTRVAEGVEIDVGAVISDSEIGAGSRVLAYSHFDGAVIGRGVRIGPFARLRPGAVLRDEVRIGNFVEVKKSTIGVGSKANHLTYLGDATVGEGVNVGAGTITCNYDGTHKYPTVLGDGVFVGSDTQFIAPVRVGEGAYIAAGSTVTDDVPAGALAISRCRQTTKEGYTARRKARDKKKAE